MKLGYVRFEEASTEIPDKWNSGRYDSMLTQMVQHGATIAHDKILMNLWGPHHLLALSQRSHVVMRLMPMLPRSIPISQREIKVVTWTGPRIMSFGLVSDLFHFFSRQQKPGG